MTRKKYIHKLQQLTLAIYNHPSSLFPEGYKIGEALKHNKNFAKNVPTKFGSYEAAWNSEAVVWACEFYGVSR